MVEHGVIHGAKDCCCLFSGQTEHVGGEDDHLIEIVVREKDQHGAFPRDPVIILEKILPEPQTLLNTIRIEPGGGEGEQSHFNREDTVLAGQSPAFGRGKVRVHVGEVGEDHPPLGFYQVENRAECYTNPLQDKIREDAYEE